MLFFVLLRELNFYNYRVECIENTEKKIYSIFAIDKHIIHIKINYGYRKII